MLLLTAALHIHAWKDKSQPEQSASKLQPAEEAIGKDPTVPTIHLNEKSSLNPPMRVFKHLSEGVILESFAVLPEGLLGQFSLMSVGFLTWVLGTVVGFQLLSRSRAVGRRSSTLGYFAVGVVP